MKFCFLVVLIVLLHAFTGVCQEREREKRTDFSIPVSFIENAGQWNREVLFASVLGNRPTAFSRDGLAFPAGGEAKTMDRENPQTENSCMMLRFINPSASLKVRGGCRKETQSNFFRGNDNDLRIRGAANFSSILYSNVWNGIDVEYSAAGQTMKQKIIVRPGGKISDIRFNGTFVPTSSDDAPFKITKAVSMNKKGHVHPLRTELQRDAAGALILNANKKRSGETAIFETEFNTHLWDGVYQQVLDYVFDSAGNIYMSGKASNSLMPLLDSRISSTRGVSQQFYFKLACDGKTLLFSTFLQTLQYWQGGKSMSMLLQSDSTIVVTLTGWDPSPSDLGDLPITSGALIKSHEYDAKWPGRLSEGYTCRLSTNGGLLYGSYLFPIIASAMDRFGNLYLACQSWNYYGINPEPRFVTPGVVRSHTDHYAPFFVKLKPSLDTVVYGSYVGPDFRAPNHGINPNETWPDSMTSLSGIAVDGECRPILYGQTSDPNFPLKNAVRTRCNDASDLFLMKLTAEAGEYVFSTYFGGSSVDACSLSDLGFDHWLHPLRAVSDNIKICVDGADNIVITGVTESHDFPILRQLKNPDGSEIQPSDENHPQRFLSKFSPSGSLLFSSYIGPLEQRFSNVYAEEDAPSNITINSCGLVYLHGYTSASSYPVFNPPPGAPVQVLDSIPQHGYQNNMVMVVDIDREKIVSSFLWGSTVATVPDLICKSDEAGYLYVSGESRSITPFNKIPGTNDSGANGFLSRVFFPLCGQDYIACTVTGLDTLTYETNRRVYLNHRDTATVSIRNTSADKPTENMMLELKLPDMLVLDPPTQSAVIALSPSTLLPGEMRTFTFTVRTNPTAARDRIAAVYAYATYRIPDLKQSCPLPFGKGFIEKPVVNTEIPFPEISCALDAPDSLALDVAQQKYNDNPFLLIATITNIGKEYADLKRAVLKLPSGMNVSVVPAGDTLRDLSILPPGEHVTLQWTIAAKERRRDAMVSIILRVFDVFDTLGSVCRKDLFLPGGSGLRCSTSAPDTLRIDPQTGRYAPEPFTTSISLENALDSTISSIEGLIDLSSAPEIALAQGEQAQRPFIFLKAGENKKFSWNLRVVNPGKDTVARTLEMMYRPAPDSAWRVCAHQVVIIPPRARVFCDLALPDSLHPTMDGYGYEPNPFSILYSIRNDGYEISGLFAFLSVSDPTLCSISGDTIRSIAKLGPGATDTIVWHARATTSRFQRKLRFGVVVKDSAGAGLVFCERSVFLPAIENDLLCTLAAPDTLHYDVVSDTYTPAPVRCTLVLENKLDTAQQVIETEIDLSSAPHLQLASGGQARKQTAGIAQGGTDHISWDLEVSASTDHPITEAVAVRYRHAGDSAWKECSKSIIIEGEPRVFSASCSSRGEDTLFLTETATIPETMLFEYSITNTGNAPLESCQVRIILPPAFSLVQPTDSTQAYDRIMPGKTMSREWLVRADLKLVVLGINQVDWRWNCGNLSGMASCPHKVYVTIDMPTKMVLGPWKLRFRAGQNDALPAAQQVRLTMPHGSSIFWQLKSPVSWIDYQPVSGTQTAMIDVRPNTTALPVSLYAGSIVGNPAAQFSPVGGIEVEYEIYELTSAGSVPPCSDVELGQSWPNPVCANQEAVFSFSVSHASYLSIRLYDVLGRFVGSLYEGFTPSGRKNIGLGTVLHHDLPPGMYKYVLTSGKTVLARTLVIVK